MKKGIGVANSITSLRILCSIGLLFCPAGSCRFYGVYLTAGITDVLDGAVARWLGTVSEFGATLDTIADILFAAACFFKLMPLLRLEAWGYLGLLLIAGIKIANILSGFVRQKKLPAVHSVMNKAAGALLFALPLTLEIIELRYSSAVVCAVAVVAAIQEGYYIRTGRFH